MESIIPNNRMIIYSDQFSKKGPFIVEKLEFTNNGINDSKAVCVVHARMLDDLDGFKVSGTLDKFTFTPIEKD